MTDGEKKQMFKNYANIKEVEEIIKEDISNFEKIGNQVLATIKGLPRGNYVLSDDDKDYIRQNRESRKCMEFLFSKRRIEYHAFICLNESDVFDDKLDIFVVRIMPDGRAEWLDSDLFDVWYENKDMAYIHEHRLRNDIIWDAYKCFGDYYNMSPYKPNVEIISNLLEKNKELIEVYDKTKDYSRIDIFANSLDSDDIQIILRPKNGKRFGTAVSKIKSGFALFCQIEIADIGFEDIGIAFYGSEDEVISAIKFFMNFDIPNDYNLCNYIRYALPISNRVCLVSDMPHIKDEIKLYFRYGPECLTTDEQKVFTEIVKKLTIFSDVICATLKSMFSFESLAYC